MTNFREYLGDGVYATYDGGDGTIVLTTENGVDVTNTIVLEPVVMLALMDWLLKIRDLEDVDKQADLERAAKLAKES